jgi:hypothetical protein
MQVEEDEAEQAFRNSNGLGAGHGAVDPSRMAVDHKLQRRSLCVAEGPGGSNPPLMHATSSKSPRNFRVTPQKSAAIDDEMATAADGSPD